MSVREDYSVLIVDDDKSNLDVLTHVLRPSYTVLVAKSGEGALRLSASELPDLILLDIVMPDLNGFEVLSRLKEQEPTRHIPVIVVSGLDSVEDEERGLFLGAVDYIRKPFDNSIVRARVKTHLQTIKQMRTIERLGLIDPLTELHNRRSFDNHLELEWNRSIREKTPLSLIMIDADNFKQYNDAYGHPQGDVLLVEVARVLEAALKRSTDLVARFGGEEFAVLLPNTDLGGAYTIAEEMRRGVERLVIANRFEGSDDSITMSAGVACRRPSPGDLECDLVELADKALYNAKNEGRNRVCIADELE